MSSSNLITVQQLAKALNCSPSTVYRLIRDKLIPFYDIRSSYRFDLKEVREALKRNGQ